MLYARLPFLVRPRQLVPPDPSGLVIGNADTGHDPGLETVPHPQPVEIKRGGRFAQEDPPADHLLQIGLRPVVDPAILHPCRVGDVDLRFLHVKKTQRVRSDQLPGLRDVQDIIGRGGNLMDIGFPGSQRPKRNDKRHVSPLSSETPAWVIAP